MNKRYIRVTAMLITIVIFAIGIYYGKDALMAANHRMEELEDVTAAETVAKFEKEYKNSLTQTRQWINLYGGIQKLLQKREIKNFLIYKDHDGFLYTKGTPMEKKQLNKSAKNLKKIYEKTQEQDGDFLFVQMPYKNFAEKEELNFYAIDDTEQNFDQLLKKIEDLKLPYIDLRKTPVEWQYFKTDHHWTGVSAFDASVQIIESLNENYHLKLDDLGTIKGKENYELVTYKEALLGSAGIQVGEYYTKKDDVEILIPRFATSLKWEHYSNHRLNLEKEGDFSEAFLNQEILNNPSYYNKYNAFLNGGACEHRVYNRLAENDLKLLFVSNSYGRPLTQYLSLYFKETRFLDPQEGRYNDSYVEYIAAYQPDVVVVMYDGVISVE